MLSRLFRRLFLEGLRAAFHAGELQFFGDLGHLNQRKAFAEALGPVRTTEWVVYAKKNFASPERLLAYLSSYTHRVAITNRRLVKFDESHVCFRWKKQRRGGDPKSKVMKLEIGEFIRRFLLYVLCADTGHACWIETPAQASTMDRALAASYMLARSDADARKVARPKRFKLLTPISEFLLAK